MFTKKTTLTRVIHWPQYDVVYLRVPKSGNKSIRLAVPDGNQVRVDICRIEQQYPGALTFSFVRNPWKRLLSTWAAKIRPPGTTTKTIIDGVHHGFTKAGLPMYAGMPFAEFAEVTCAHSDEETEKHLRSQSYYLVRDGVVIPEFVGRVESMGEDWARLQERTGIAESLPHFNRNPHGNLRDHYDTRLVNLVGDRYRQDAEIFAYDFDA